MRHLLFELPGHAGHISSTFSASNYAPVGGACQWEFFLILRRSKAPVGQVANLHAGCLPACQTPSGRRVFYGLAVTAVQVRPLVRIRREFAPVQQSIKPLE
jgi:hypothetical protein